MGNDLPHKHSPYLLVPGRSTGFVQRTHVPSRSVPCQKFRTFFSVIVLLCSVLFAMNFLCFGFFQDSLHYVANLPGSNPSRKWRVL